MSIPLWNRILRRAYASYRAEDISASREYRDYINKHMYDPVSENVELQKKLLYETVMYAIHHVEFYRNLYAENPFSIHCGSIFEDVRNFPVLTKQILTENQSSLRSDETFGRVCRNATGGSTGHPVQFLQDGGYLQRQDDIVFCFDAVSGYMPGEKRALLWGAERDILASHGIGRFKSAIARRFVRRTIVLNSFRLSSAQMLDFVKRVNRFQPDYMLAYAQSAYEFARFIEENNLSVHPFKSIITSAGMLYDDFRETIERVFGCPVYDRYGSREVGLIAMECECHNGKHINIFSQYVEIVDDNNEPIPPEANQTGRVLVTQLTNRVMPLIRYDIGDMAQISGRICDCGRGLPLLEALKGRTVSTFRTREQVQVDGEYFTHLFYGLSYVRQFQVIQHAYERIEVCIALSDGHRFDDHISDFEDMKNKIRLVMGESCDVEYKVVDEIMPTESGKRHFTISYVH